MLIPVKNRIFSMRSHKACLLNVLKFKQYTLGEHAFAVDWCVAWNCLPTEIPYMTFGAFKLEDPSFRKMGC